MTDNLLTLVVQTGGQLTGMVIKSTMQSIPGLIGLVAGAPITLLTAGIGAAASLAAAAIFVGILK
ncbi:MAG: hypothetical protein WCE81_07025 [Halobacteriota archaeon]